MALQAVVVAPSTLTVNEESETLLEGEFSIMWVLELFFQDYGLRFRRSRLGRVGLLRLALDWLHVIREIHMVSSFQLNRSARLILAHQRTLRSQRES